MDGESDTNTAMSVSKVYQRRSMHVAIEDQSLCGSTLTHSSSLTTRCNHTFDISLFILDL